MEKDQNNIKKPLSENTIFRNMMIAVYAVASIFFLKNLISQTWKGAIVIGICLAIFAAVAAFMRHSNVEQTTQQLTLCISISVLVFVISLNSGNFYSDDFPLFLAVVSISGLYLVPKFAIIQMIIIDIMFTIMYIVHPEKADPLSQYIMCVGLFTITSYIIYMLIKRGRAYIEIGHARAEEAEQLLLELKNAGEELQHNCDSSTNRIARLAEANERLENSAEDLRLGSVDITQGTLEVAETFRDVQERMQVTEQHIDALNQEVKKVETSLDNNKQNMAGMTSHMEALKNTVAATDNVFVNLQEQILEISKATEQLTKIASSTTMLALNASIEAARAGQMGAGFAVVASKVQELAEDSNNCSNHVVSVVNSMQQRIEETARQLSTSTNAINASLDSLHSYQDDFEQLTTQFGSLYSNIEEQNDNVHQMDAIFEDLKLKISEMTQSSEASQNSVTAITDAINIYKDNMNMVADDNRMINELSASMLELSHMQIDLDD